MIRKREGVMVSTAYNRAYMAPRLRHSVQILLRRTSDTLGTLSAIADLM